MPAKDLQLSVAASLVTAVFLVPTLLNNGFFETFPLGWAALFVVFPIVCLVGMTVANILGKKIKIIWQLAKFGFVGVLNTAIDFGVFNALISLTSITSEFGIILLNATSFSTAVVNSYFWNKQWVFAGNKKSNFATFLTITLIGLSINTGIVYVITTFIDPIIVTDKTQWANIAKVIATPLSMMWNFLGYKIIVFHK